MWIGVDIDGTLAHYDGWRGDTHIGEPIWPMVSRVKRWLGAGKVVKIFTARLDQNTPEYRDIVVARIREWLITSAGLPADLEVTNTKDRHMAQLWDDRAVAVEANTGHVLGGVVRE